MTVLDSCLEAVSRVQQSEGQPKHDPTISLNSGVRDWSLERPSYLELGVQSTGEKGVAHTERKRYKDMYTKRGKTSKKDTWGT